MKISLLINMKMPTIVDIFISIGRENFMLSRIEHKNKFIISGPGILKTRAPFEWAYEYPKRTSMTV